MFRFTKYEPKVGLGWLIFKKSTLRPDVVKSITFIALKVWIYQLKDLEKSSRSPENVRVAREAHDAAALKSETF